MSNAHRVDDISDELWSKIENHLPVLKGKWGRVTKDKRGLFKLDHDYERLMINSIFLKVHKAGMEAKAGDLQ